MSSWCDQTTLLISKLKTTWNLHTSLRVTFCSHPIGHTQLQETLGNGVLSWAVSRLTVLPKKKRWNNRCSDTGWNESPHDLLHPVRVLLSFCLIPKPILPCSLWNTGAGTLQKHVPASLVSYLLDSGDCLALEDCQAGGERGLGTSFASRLYEHHPRNASLGQYICCESTLHSFQYRNVTFHRNAESASSHPCSKTWTQATGIFSLKVWVSGPCGPSFQTRDSSSNPTAPPPQGSEVFLHEAPPLSFWI